MEFHDYANVFPLMDNDELTRLAEDIKQNGLHEPIVIYEGKILDGRNRARACQRINIAPTRTTYNGSDPVGFVVSKNLHRRHLNESQRAMVAAKVANLKHGQRADYKRENEDRPIGQSAVSIDGAAKMVNVGTQSVIRAKRILSQGTEKDIKDIESGVKKVSSLAEKLPKQKRKKAPISNKRASDIANAKKLRIALEELGGLPHPKDVANNIHKSEANMELVSRRVPSAITWLTEFWNEWNNSEDVDEPEQDDIREDRHHA